jgi:protein-S-isoprenylcysteine O-methyltransferase Ste14
VSFQAWLPEHFTSFRVALFFCCFGYWMMGCVWLKPRGREMPAAIMAAWVQFSLGVLMDMQFVRLDYWTYRPARFSLGGVPLDLHVDWALVWGFGLVWLYSRLRLHERGWRFVPLYLSAWALFTVALDSVIAAPLLFRASAAPLWWIADAVFLFVLLGVTLWVYHSILFPPRQPILTMWSCRARSALYIGSLTYVFYVYLPGVVLSLTWGWNVRPLFGLEDWRVLGAALLSPLLLGAWANLSFMDIGCGTALPLDPPRRLVTTGPYAYVRNPMQISGTLLAVLLVLYHPTAFMLIYVVDLILASTLLIHLYERGQMREAFGDEYLHYQTGVRNWLPRPRPYRRDERNARLSGD